MGDKTETLLPKCPLCGHIPERYGRSKQVRCPKRHCTIYAISWFNESEWRRLAAPPLPPEIVAVLEAFAGSRDASDIRVQCRSNKAFTKAVREWESAGRPGLSEKEEK